MDDLWCREAGGKWSLSWLHNNAPLNVISLLFIKERTTLAEVVTPELTLDRL